LQPLSHLQREPWPGWERSSADVDSSSAARHLSRTHAPLVATRRIAVTRQELSLAAYGTSRDPEAQRGEPSQVKLGRYEIVRELGKGAMGIVYLAKDPLIGRLVALKTIRPAAHADDDEAKEFQQRFVREAQAAGILNHPGIVTVHDIGQDEVSGVSFIAMEYVEGQNLKEALAQGRPLNFDQIGDIIAQVADGLDFAHSKGIVHRDVKPANIILIEGLRAKITDFGIAKIASGGANLTSTGQFLGTPNYMAPEQIKGAPVDGRTDIFSLGICFYECLTRRKPFGGDSLTSISYKIVHEPFPPLLEINPQIPEGYEEVVAMCLQKDPAKRFQRGRDLANAIRAVVRGERPVRPPDPMLADETIVTRDHDKIPTVEIPFPDAASGDANGFNPAYTATSMAAAIAASAPAAVMPGLAPAAGSASGSAPKPRPASRPPKPSARAMMRQTLDGVRAYPIWYSRIPPLLFLAIPAICALALLLAVVDIRKRFAPPRTVDTKAEARRSKERRIRQEGNSLNRQKRVDDAYAKFQELARLAPNSPAINELLRELDSKRQEEQANKDQLAQAKEKFNQGLSFINNKQFPEAIKAFEESLHLNNSDEAANYLKLAQQADELARMEKQQRQQMRQQQATTTGSQRPPLVPPPTTTRGGTTTTNPVVAGAPARLTTIVNANVTDGYIMVKAGAQVLAYEQLWEETGRFFTKRRVPRPVNVTKELTPANTDLDVWFVIQSLNVQDHKVIRQNFLPGVVHTLTVTFDPQSKHIDYHLN
jgi:serine/threonine protein kinase